MDEYISREDILDIASQYCADDDGSCSKADVDLREMLDEIEALPAADVQPVKHGRWIEKPPYKDETVKGLEFQIVCSECDEQNCSLEFDENYNAIGKTFYKTRYCPNCGARMDGDAE